MLKEIHGMNTSKNVLMLTKGLLHHVIQRIKSLFLINEL